MTDALKSLLRLRQDRRGAAVLETALALPVLLMMAFAFIDLTLAFAFRMSLQEHAQAGADFVVASGSKVPADNQVKQAVADYSGLPTSAITITRTFDCNGNSASTTATSCPNSTDLRVNYMRIKVQDSYTPILKIPSFADFVPTGAMSRSATVRLP